YQTTYIMADGTQVVTEWQSSESSQIYINSPFTQHTFSFLAEGDFVGSVDNIFLKMRYLDDVNHIDQQTDFTFTAANQSKDWTIPVIASGKGQITYSGVVSYKGHTKEELPPATTDRDLIEFGPPNQVIISVTPDATLIDFNQVRIVKVDVAYKDEANNIDMKHEFLLKAGATTAPSWTFYARDRGKTSYTYATTFYMGTTPPTVVQSPPATSSDTDLILMMPS
nr:hypothetical protein [Caulobacteraceae bacterium]